ncbi:MAG: CoA transferase [Acidobacteria bacterium]|nr:CoA transferase [Acidobacteriota bacterium]
MGPGLRQPLLSGVRVLDLSRFLAGPFGSMILGDLGAEVIKIEEPGQGDPMRQMPPYFLEGESAYFLSINRNKLSITLNLGHVEGREVFYDLVKVADVVYENYRPGVMERLGLGYEKLRSINPRIIVCSISGFGQTGPHRDRPAFDLVLQAMSGAMSITGEPEGAPVRMGIPMGDLAGGMFAVKAITAALYSREKTGEGCFIDLGLMDCLVSLLTYVAQYYLAGSPVPEPAGSHHQSVVPYGTFATADGFLVVAVFAERFWPAFCRAIGRTDLAEDSRFVRNDSRLAHRKELMEVLAELFRHESTSEWLARLEKEGVPCGPVNKVDQVLNDPQTKARHMLTSTQHPLIGNLPILGNPIKVEGIPEHFAPPPLLGEHTGRVLTELLAYSDDKISTLRKSRII